MGSSTVQYKLSEIRDGAIKQVLYGHKYIPLVEIYSDALVSGKSLSYANFALAKHEAIEDDRTQEEIDFDYLIVMTDSLRSIATIQVRTWIKVYGAEILAALWNENYRDPSDIKRGVRIGAIAEKYNIKKIK